jgi:hypothetical protein
MSFITGKHIPRRTFLRGAGATVALPFLDAMVPAGKHWSIAGAALEKTRLIAMEQSHGAAGCTAWGSTQYLWNPQKIGRGFDISGGALSSLEPFRDHLTIVSNCDMRMAEAFEAPEIGGDHFRRPRPSSRRRT